MVDKKTKVENKKEAKADAKVEKTITMQTKSGAACADSKCVIHGKLPARGRVFEGIVISDKMQKTVTVEWPGFAYIAKYERYEKKRSRIHARNPACISARTGDMVRIVETRPIAKTVKFVVVEKLPNIK